MKKFHTFVFGQRIVLFFADNLFEVNVCIYMYTFVYVYIQMYIYIYIHVHTHADYLFVANGRAFVAPACSRIFLFLIQS